MPTLSPQQQRDLQQLCAQLSDPLIASLSDHGARLYVVGGSVRDTLLARKHHDFDFVVVGAGVSLMLSSGFTQVGRDFPVFLHPKNNTQFALARLERSLGEGHGDFSFDVNSVVTLEEDLIRRDFTINAMAVGTDAQLIDPYNGFQDLQERVLRHISDSFREDPLRVFRGARFLAQLSEWGFKLHHGTALVFTQMSLSGTLASLSAERVWTETELALRSSGAAQFFKTLAAVHALTPWFIELVSPTQDEDPKSSITERGPAFKVSPASSDKLSTPIGNRSGITSTDVDQITNCNSINQTAILALSLACDRTTRTEVRYAALMAAALFKTQVDEPPSTDLMPLAICQRLKVPQSHQKLLIQLHRHFWSLIHIAESDPNIDQLTLAAVLLNLLTELGAHKSRETAYPFCEAVMAVAEALDASPRKLKPPSCDSPQATSGLVPLASSACQIVHRAADMLPSLNHATIKQQQPKIFTDKTGAQIGQIIEAWRLEKLANLLRSNLT